MNQFRVREGVHFHEGVEYKKGDVVTTYDNLCDVFPNKFDVVQMAPQPVPLVPPTVAAPSAAPPPVPTGPQPRKTKSVKSSSKDFAAAKPARKWSEDDEDEDQ